MYRITGVVRHLLIINILAFFGAGLLGEPNYRMIQEGAGNLSLWGRDMFAMFYPTSVFFQPFQIVTHMFMHGNFTHLFFNMFALFMFGPPVEAAWGPRKFLFYYFFTGFGALALHMLVTYIEFQTGMMSSADLSVHRVLGASGAVFGLLLAYGWLYPNSRIMLLIPPIPMKAKYFVMIYAGLELFLGFSRTTSGVAHFAHVGGALFGLLLILYWRRYGSRF